MTVLAVTSSAVTIPAAVPSPSPSASSTVSAELAQRVAAGNIGPGWVAFVFVVGIGVALILLMRSMRHQVRKVTFVEAPLPGGVAAGRRPVWPERAAPAGGATSTSSTGPAGDVTGDRTAPRSTSRLRRPPTPPVP